MNPTRARCTRRPVSGPSCSVNGAAGPASGATLGVSGASVTAMNRLLILLGLVMITMAPAAADWRADVLVRVCPATPGAVAPPDFSDPRCEVRPYWVTDPQRRTLWIEAVIEIDEPPGALTGPYALFVSGKLAARAWVNGVEIGANGTPGFTADTETPGLMDAALFSPVQLLRSGENRVVLLASGRNSLVTLSTPIHRIAIGEFRSPRIETLQSYQSALATFGVFVIALVFFAVLAAASGRRGISTLLALIALTAGLQLLAEAWRGLTAYRYPVHDLRLIALAGGAAALAMLTGAWSAARFTPERARLNAVLLGALAALTASAIVFAPGFDQKSVYALVLGALAAAVPPTLCAAAERRPAAAIWAGGFVVFIAAGLAAPQSLLDRTVFWALSALLLLNIIDEARRFVAERAARVSETRRADALAGALARAEQAARPVQIALNASGRTHYAKADEIARLDAADDYVEVRFKDAPMVLHTGTLGDLEARLPATFLRVHRSCVVNTDVIAALERDANGSGRLILTSGDEAPVSRRILPAVKAALSSA